MKKSDLISGRTIVQLRNGRTYLMINNRFAREEGFTDICNFKDDLTYKSSRYFPPINLDIVKVAIYDLECHALEAFITKYIEWDWERPEIKEMTLEQIEEALGYKIEIVKEETDE